MANIAQLLTEHMDIWTAAESEKKTGRGRASGNTGNVYGVKKLRELILELAVRGKLVSQDPNDESASELLKRIQAEKAKLIAAGKLKKEKMLASIDEDEKPFELPSGWAYASFGDVVEIVRGITFPGSEKTRTPEDGRVACLRTTNVQDQIEWEDILYIREQFVSRDDQFIMPNDIVMSMANSRELVGKVALVGNNIKERTSFGGFLGVIRPYFILPKFVMALLRTPHTREELIDSASQTTNIANISLAKLKPLFFAIPPLDEQHRIITKIDELMALCDQLEQQHSNAQQAHDNLVSQLLATLTQSQNAAEFNANWQRIYAHFDVLFTTEASIDALKQTLLQLAVMGKLVPQDPSDEPASELLKRTQAEKAKLKKEKPLAPISEDEKPFELPNGWEWVMFGELISLINGDRSKNYPNQSEYVENGVPWINTGHIEPDGTLTTSEMNYITQNKYDELRSGKIEENDLVYCLRGATFGKTAFVKPYTTGAIASSLVIIRPHNKKLAYYIYKYLISPFGKSQVYRFDNGSAQPNLSANSVTLYSFPLPPLAEQNRIVAKVDALMALCDQLKTRIQQANQQQQAIADALAEQAVA